MALGQVFIQQGPGRYDLLLGSLLEGEAVRFSIRSNVGTRIFVDRALLDQFQARIVSASRPERGSSAKRADEFLIMGEVLAFSGSGQRVGLRFSGSYNVHTRKGVFEFEERPYEGGDAVSEIGFSVIGRGIVTLPKRVE